MLHTDRVIITEGRYDSIRLSSLTDALIITTGGFGIFNDKEKREFIKKLASEKGLIVLTDSDAAGFKIRNLINNTCKNADIINVYIPDVYGKEGRKDSPSKEGKIGVEGMNTDILKDAFLRSGAFSENESGSGRKQITNADLYEAGLSGGPNSAEKRRQLLTSLGLPARLGKNNMLKALNMFITYEDFISRTKAGE